MATEQTVRALFELMREMDSEIESLPRRPANEDGYPCEGIREALRRANQESCCILFSASGALGDGRGSCEVS